MQNRLTTQHFIKIVHAKEETWYSTFWKKQLPPCSDEGKLANRYESKSQLWKGGGLGEYTFHNL